MQGEDELGGGLVRRKRSRPDREESSVQPSWALGVREGEGRGWRMEEQPLRQRSGGEREPLQDLSGGVACRKSGHLKRAQFGSGPEDGERSSGWAFSGAKR